MAEDEKKSNPDGLNKLTAVERLAAEKMARKMLCRMDNDRMTLNKLSHTFFDIPCDLIPCDYNNAINDGNYDYAFVSPVLKILEDVKSGKIVLGNTFSIGKSITERKSGEVEFHGFNEEELTRIKNYITKHV